MASFDPKPNPIDPGVDFTRSSEGIRSTPFNALGHLFEGVATAIDTGVKEIDRRNMQNIEDEINAGVDAIHAEFGVADATLFQENARPSELASAGENLDRLQAAYEKGALKESHYWARMNSMVRQLRARYPGYRSEIDQMVASITGGRPANQLRNALFDEWAANARSKADSPLAKLEDWALKDGTLPADYYSRAEAGAPYSLNELQRYVAKKTADAQNLISARAQLAFQAEQGTQIADQASQTWRAEANQLVTNLLTDSMSTAAPTYAQLQMRISEAQKSIAAGKPLDPQELNTLRGQMGELKMLIRQQLHAASIESWDGDPMNSYVRHMKPADIEAVINEAMTPITVLETALNSDNPWGVLGSTAAYMDALKQGTQMQLLQQIPALQTLQALQDIAGADATNFYLGLNEQVQSSLTQSFLDFERSRAALGEGSVSEAFERGEAANQGSDYYNALISGWTKTIDELGSDNLPIEIIQNNVQYMFGDTTVLSQMTDQSRFEYFRKVASPRVTNKMVQLKDMGDIESWNTYQQWVTSGFYSLFQQSVQNIQEYNTGADFEGIKISWNPATMGFEQTGMQEGFWVGPINNLAARTQINDLNSVIRTVAPIINENSGDVPSEIYLLLQQMGYDPEEARDPSMLQMMGDALAGLLGGLPEIKEHGNGL